MTSDLYKSVHDWINPIDFFRAKPVAACVRLRELCPHLPNTNVICAANRKLTTDNAFRNLAVGPDV